MEPTIAGFPRNLLKQGVLYSWLVVEHLPSICWGFPAMLSLKEVVIYFTSFFGRKNINGQPTFLDALVHMYDPLHAELGC